MHIRTYIHADKDMDGVQTDLGAYIEPDRHAHGQRDRETERQRERDRETERQRDRETERQNVVSKGRSVVSSSVFVCFCGVEGAKCRK